MAEYHFVSTWQLEAPVSDVYEALHDYEQYPEWWPDVREVTEVERGDDDGIGGVVRYVVRSPLRYSLGFNVRLVEATAPTRISTEAFGDLEGTGVWELEDSDGVTTGRYHWDVATTQWWMNLLAPVARPAFGWAHGIVTRNGAEGLAGLLGARLVSAS